MVGVTTKFCYETLVERGVQQQNNAVTPSHIIIINISKKIIDHSVNEMIRTLRDIVNKGDYYVDNIFK